MVDVESIHMTRDRDLGTAVMNTDQTSEYQFLDEHVSP